MFVYMFFCPFSKNETTPLNGTKQTNKNMETIPLIQVNCRLSSHWNKFRHEMVDKVFYCPDELKQQCWSVYEVKIEKYFCNIRRSWMFGIKMFATWRNTDFKDYEFCCKYSRPERKYEPLNPNVHNWCTFRKHAHQLFHESPGLTPMYIWTYCPQNVLYRLPLDLMHMIADFI